MANLFITEFDSADTPSGGVCVPVARAYGYVEQTPVAIAGASAQSAAFAAETTLVRIHAAGICSIAFGPNPTATTNTMRLAADQTEYFSVPAGQSWKVAVIQNS